MNRPHILLIEDNPSDALLTTLALRRLSRPFSLHVAEDGAEALRYLAREQPHDEAEPPDLVILDLNLPRIDGTGVLEFIRAQPEIAHLPVVIFSSSPMDVLRARAANANRHIEKPFGVDNFMAAARQIWECWENPVH